MLAFMLDLLVLTLGGLAGLGAGLLGVQSSNTIAGMGNVVVFLMLAGGGCALVWVSLVGITAASGRSPGQRVMGLRYDVSVGHWQRSIHFFTAWLVPAVLIAVPALTLNGLGNYRNELQREYSDYQQAQPEPHARSPEFEAKLNALELKLKRADWFAPEWLVGNDDLPWMAVMYGPLLIYLLVNLALLRREPYTAVHDRITGVSIVKA
jgi:hypothetical protein